MVKVLENRVVDLDILPGIREQQKVMHRAQQKDEDEDEEEDAWSSSDEFDQGALAHAHHAATALSGAVGGTVKGVVDTAGNTVHSLGTGVFGTVMGVGKGLGIAAAYSGTAIGKTFGFGVQRGGHTKEYEGLSRPEIRSAKKEARRRVKLSIEERWRLEKEELELELELEEAQREFHRHEPIRIESKKE